MEMITTGTIAMSPKVTSNRCLRLVNMVDDPYTPVECYEA